MYEISTSFSISSAHYLRNYDGKCKNLHGHNWKIIVYIVGNQLDNKDMLIDFNCLKKYFDILKNELDHKNLNEIEYFSKFNPTAEKIAEYIFYRVSDLLQKDNISYLSVSKVTVFETENCQATYLNSNKEFKN